MSQTTVALLIAVVAAVGGVLAAWVTSRGAQKTTATAAVTQILEKAYNQRIEFRDEQIEELRAELAKATSKIQELTLEVQRLTAIALGPGGMQHD